MSLRQPAARRRLAELGLLDRRHRGNFTDSESVRLRIALEEIGPLFAVFGRYLGSRVDLLPLSACATLAKTRVCGADETPIDKTPSVTGIEIHPEPFKTSFLHLWRRGVLNDGRTVIVKTVRNTMVKALEDQIEDLPVLEKLRLVDLTTAGDAVEAYLVWLERQFDLRREFDGLRRLASQSPNFDALFVPRLWEGNRVREALVCFDSGGKSLSDLDVNSGDSDENREWAHRLCSSWLQQALFESVLPEGPPEENLLLLEDGRIAVTGGLFSSLGRRSRRGLLDSLIATSRGDPDRACGHLLGACDADLDDADHDRLKILFRQADPFRDGGWSENYHGRRLADTLCVQWRLLRREGIDIPPSVVAYIRSLHQIESCARRLSPEHDGFAVAVDDLSVVAAASRVRETFSVRRVRGILEAAAPVLREVVERADRLGAESNERSDESKSKPSARGREWSEVAGLLLLMIATVVSARELGAAGIGGGWLQTSATVIFAALAVVALWRTARGWHSD